MLCDCRKDFNSILFSYEIAVGRDGRECFTTLNSAFRGTPQQCIHEVTRNGDQTSPLGWPYVSISTGPSPTIRP